MLDLLVECELEAKLVSSLDIVGCGTTSLRTLVAPEVGRVDDLAGERGHVAVGVLTGVSVVTTDSLAVDNETVHDVMSVGPQGRKQREDKSGLHVVKRMNMFKRSECKKVGKANVLVGIEC